MKLLVNASNLVIGGGVQVGVWFIRTCIEKKVNAHFLFSPKIYQELMSLNVDLQHVNYSVIEHSPSRDKAARSDIQRLCEHVAPDAVYTIFGPAYVKFRPPHITGFADGWVSHSTWESFKKTFASAPLNGLKLIAASIYKAWAIRLADAWIFEAKVAAVGLARRARLPQSQCHVVSNNCSDIFIRTPVKPMQTGRRFSLLYLTADYPHKGVINFIDYARELHALAVPATFVITIDKHSPSARKILLQAAQEGLLDYFDFKGYVPISNVIGLMDESNVVMQMSYLETFSANYPEAMARKRPLLVSNYAFARNICDNAAIYVDPSDAKDVAKAINNLYKDEELQASLIANGKRVLGTFPTLEQRFEQYIQIIEDTIKLQKDSEKQQ